MQFSCECKLRFSHIKQIGYRRVAEAHIHCIQSACPLSWDGIAKPEKCSLATLSYHKGDN